MAQEVLTNKDTEKQKPGEDREVSSGKAQEYPNYPKAKEALILPAMIDVDNE